MKSQMKVLLTVECRNMKAPKRQRYLFDQTLGTNSWMLQENKTPDIHDDGTVTTASVWGRAFSGRKTKEDIIRITRNLLKRAAKEAGIEDYRFDFQFDVVMGNAEPFTTISVMTQDD